ncbi:phage virion morphogenesis protein [Mitsuaria sp. GD03876]|uniref:phage virion morphogenesis protein n=1 Tax=Mitsuaria sp. GD03876 TaxID=2975399 RepID=UPI002446F068|nr:phage virion morphogenesis protein [Mitsuaria sp. GD03876]MDH0866449.1 phage virion morphogenesis protein [Mitsuaria sp. GD03876]
MTEDLRALDDWLAPLLAGITPTARRRLARDLARDLRRQQQQRIAAQLNPDGTRYEARKATLRDRKGKIRRGAMFAKIRTATHLRVEASPDQASVGFAGRVARIASVHQLGLRDRVRPDGPEVQYAARRLLGLTTEDREWIRDRILHVLASYAP